MNFGEKLQRLRITRGLSRRKLSQLAGISSATYSKYERGEKPYCHLEDYERLAKALSCDVYFLMDDDLDFIPSHRRAVFEKDSESNPTRSLLPEPDGRKAGHETVTSSGTPAADKLFPGSVILEYKGHSTDMEELVARVTNMAGGSPYHVYIKPHEHTLYYVIEKDVEISGSFTY